MNLKDKIRLGLAVFLIGVNALVWQAVYAREGNRTLTVAFLSIGQGDGIFIEAPNGNQMMIDGGPGKIVLSELGSVMPFFDHSIDLLLVTNPDKDHFGGFIDVLNRYKVTTVIEPGTHSDTGTYKEFEKDIQKENAERVIAKRGMDVELGGGVVFHIFFPDRDVLGLASNEGSIVGKLTYGKRSILFMGDSVQNVEKYIVQIDGTALDSDILKVGHHGSRTSTSLELLQASTPDIAVISSGKNNTYGHPHKETLDNLAKNKIKMLNTADEGRLIFTTDGIGEWVKN
ncbi:MAG: MBL fold metallo-hydrolase [Candidatus Taylorbacteria bacterium]